jgi:hypothetical protein
VSVYHDRNIIEIFLFWIKEIVVKSWDLEREKGQAEAGDRVSFLLLRW